MFHRHAKRVQMTNIAQMVNVLQAMILTDGPRMALTPTYHAFHLYLPFQGATSLPAEIRTPNYSVGETTVPAVSVSAARDVSGRLQYALVNTDPRREAVVTTDVTGANVRQARGRVLTARTMDARNTVDKPEQIYPVKFAGTRENGKIVLRLPPMSVSVVELQ
jgi:alpha-N-arabinofuranosidase